MKGAKTFMAQMEHTLMFGDHDPGGDSLGLSSMWIKCGGCNNTMSFALDKEKGIKGDNKEICPECEEGIRRGKIIKNSKLW